ncbi:8121_t:CDS:2 [Ambispora gerdemannii]|uniref:8121_t:CDS:1 n=1 Tax=Ambispora gerdemannii TaxID=144530 RepID=A0A9N8YI62_9GLOM|nr:8121_t:CDS:2 [Ambispora gerdemannii]
MVVREGVYLLGDASLGSNIFVRQCYRDFAKVIFADDNVRSWCIAGNPGVGKSLHATTNCDLATISVGSYLILRWKRVNLFTLRKIQTINWCTKVPALPEEIEQEKYAEDDESKEDRETYFREDLRRFLTVNEGEGSLSTLRGHIFETIAHANGGTFQVWPLNEILKMNSSLIAAPTLVFSDNTQIQAGKYCRPQQKQYESIDSLISPDTLFQVANDQIRLYFVIPLDSFIQFKCQPYLRADGHVAKRVQPWIKHRVKQYSLKVDLNLEKVLLSAQ